MIRVHLAVFVAFFVLLALAACDPFKAFERYGAAPQQEEST